MRHVIQQRKGRDLVVHLVVGTDAEVEDVFQLLRRIGPAIVTQLGNFGITATLVEERGVERKLVIQSIGQFQLAFRRGSIPSVFLRGWLAVVVGKAQVGGEAVAQLHTDVGHDGHQLGLVAHQVIAVPNRDFETLGNGEDHIDRAPHIQRVVVGKAIAHAQMHVHDVHDVGADATVEAELHVGRTQRWIDTRVDKRIVVDKVAEAQQPTSTVQACIELEFVVQDEEAGAHVGANGQEAVLIRVFGSAVETHTQVQAIEPTAHLEERIDGK